MYKFKVYFQTFSAGRYVNRKEDIWADNKKEAKKELLKKHPDASSINIERRNDYE